MLHRWYLQGPKNISVYIAAYRNRRYKINILMYLHSALYFHSLQIPGVLYGIPDLKLFARSTKNTCLGHWFSVRLQATSSSSLAIKKRVFEEKNRVFWENRGSRLNSSITPLLKWIWGNKSIGTIIGWSDICLVFFFYSTKLMKKWLFKKFLAHRIFISNIIFVLTATSLAEYFPCAHV